MRLRQRQQGALLLLAWKFTPASRANGWREDSSQPGSFPQKKTKGTKEFMWE